MQFITPILIGLDRVHAPREAGADQKDLAVKTPPEGNDWYYAGPHVMVVLPDANKEA